MGTYTGTPRTWVASELVDDTILNSAVRDPLTALGSAFASYTPILTGFTPGNGTVAGAYTQFGKLVIFKASFTFGSASAAASAVPTFTIPVPASTAFSYIGLIGGRAIFTDAGSTSYAATAALISSTTVGCYIQGTNGSFGQPTTTTPFTWTTSDIISVSGWYEAA